MIRILTCITVVPFAASIIVKDPPLKSSDYKYSYAIQDPATGDNKNQQEERYGNFVKGSYSLIDPDGTRRTVEYTADPKNGFNAVVHKETPNRGNVYGNTGIKPTNFYQNIPQNEYVIPQNGLYDYPYHFYSNDEDYENSGGSFTARESKQYPSYESAVLENHYLYQPVNNKYY